ncbi:hypothetical protein [Bordetella sp. BOR01]|uniref:hypothetical protein n=1 Tax=Bordetella sp. BOR01 TaxID=2854779 RepID=UPI001C483612|nr:hypothetical protein [Bordetella sp. BOR01]MBV7485808.1 hypothetical protein [Bordetella sp. BOR01]
MPENPFESGPTPAQQSNTPEQGNYLILISASKDNLALAQRLVKNIQNRIDGNAAPLWIDSKGIGVFAKTFLVAHEIWQEAFRDMGDVGAHETKDVLVLKIGDDWAARKEAPTTNWLTINAGAPRLASRRVGKPR